MWHAAVAFRIELLMCLFADASDTTREILTSMCVNRIAPQAPLCRFGDTAANAGMLRLLRDAALPLWLKTAAASGTAAAWRILLTPIDTVKVIMQVEGSAGREVLRRKLADRGFAALYDGASSSAAATAAAHWPWFLVRFADSHARRGCVAVERTCMVESARGVHVSARCASFRL